MVAPAARAWDFVLPDVVETGIDNFFENSRAPVDVLNNVLQGEFEEGYLQAWRFVLNTSFGIAGVILNRGGSAKHRALIAAAIAALGVPVLGAVPRDAFVFILSSAHEAGDVLQKHQRHLALRAQLDEMRARG